MWPSLWQKNILRPLRGTGIDTLVLGCTHYPLLKVVISRAVGSKIILIDSATEKAKESAVVLERLNWKRHAEGIRKFYVTDTPVRFETIGNRFLGDGLLLRRTGDAGRSQRTGTNCLLVFCHGDAAETKYLDVMFL